MPEAVFAGQSETIVALATARGRAAIAVIRISGPRAREVAEKLAPPLPKPRRAALRTLVGEDGVIDHGLVLWFPAPKSYTGEDLVEFHLHGGLAVCQAALNAVLRFPGVRTAEPGEFARRAFEAGKLSLPEVEAIADLVAAETEAQRRLAVSILEGKTGARIALWRDRLVQARALCEALIDFPDEDIPEAVTHEILSHAASVHAEIVSELKGRHAAERIREGYEVAIVGPVNVGKSTLLNALAGREAAITSERAGTTRDVIEVRMDLRGLPVTILDTAGIRESEDPVEQIGIARGQARARTADLRIYLKAKPDDEVVPQAPDDIVLLSKADLWGLPGISALTGQGLSDLIDAIYDRLAKRQPTSLLFSHARHFDRLELASAHLAKLSTALAAGFSYELAAEELRLALRALDALMGRVDVEEVLDRIFASFCIGK